MQRGYMSGVSMCGCDLLDRSRRYAARLGGWRIFVWMQDPLDRSRRYAAGSCGQRICVLCLFEDMLAQICSATPWVAYLCVNAGPGTRSRKYAAPLREGRICV